MRHEHGCLDFGGAARWLGVSEAVLRLNYERMPGFKKLNNKTIIFHPATWVARTFPTPT